MRNYELEEKNSLLLETKLNDQTIIATNLLLEDFKYFDLRKYFLRSTTLQNILWEFDGITFLDDILHHYFFLFNVDKKPIFLYRKKAESYDNWFFHLFKDYLEKHSESIDFKCKNLENLIDIINFKSPYISDKIKNQQHEILNEFKENRSIF